MIMQHRRAKYGNRKIFAALHIHFKLGFFFTSKKYKYEMGNFYIVEAGGNGFAARKQKKNSSQGSKADKAFLPSG